MHTMWKGSVSFGLVSIPVRMYAATEDKDVRFRYLHKACHTPVRYVKRCPRCDVDLSEEDIVRGFEIEPNRFVILDETDFEAITPKKSRSIEIMDFVNLSDIDPIYFAKSYYLAPEETSLKAYALLREAMRQKGKIAIAKMVIRSSESLAALRFIHDTLVIETLYYPDEVRNFQELPFSGVQPAVDLREMDMATTLIDHLSAPFQPDKYKNDYRSSLMDVIAKKAQEQTMETAPDTAVKGNVVDLMRALQESIEAAKSSEPAQPDKPQKPVKRRSKQKTG